MPTARTLALLFTSVLLLFTIFWFWTPSHFPSLHFDGLERVFSCLQHKRNNEKIESFTNREAQFSNQDFDRLEAEYSVKDYQSVANFPLHPDKPVYKFVSPPAISAHYSNEKLASDVTEVSYSNENLASDVKEVGLGISPTIDDMYQDGVIIEAHDGKWPHIENNSNNSSETVIVTGDKHDNANSEKVSATISTSQIVERKRSDNTESIIGNDVQYAGPTFISSDVLEERPCADLEYNNMDPNQDFQSSEFQPLVELESVGDGAYVFAKDAYTKQDLNIAEALDESIANGLQMVKETTEVLDAAAPKLSINEKASSEELDKLKASSYDEVALNDDDPASRSTSEMSDQNSENLHDEIMLNMSLNEMDDIVLSKKNFSDFILENRYVVVNFYMQWSYWKKAEYAAAANMLKDKVMFASVDANEEKELARKYRFLGYPSMYFFIRGVHMHTYRYCCRRDSVVSWVKEKMNGGVYSVIRLSEALDISMSDSMIILGYLDTLEGPDSEELAAASKLENDVIFYQTASEFVAKMLHINPEAKRPALFMLRKDAGKFIHFDGPFNRYAIANFVSINKFPLITTVNAHNGLLILKNHMKQLWLFAFDNNLDKVMFTFQEAAKAFNGKLLFVYIKMDHKDVARRLSYEIGVTWNEPKVIAYSGTEALMKYAMNGELSFSNIKSFGENFLEDKISGKPITSSNFLFERLIEW